MPFILRRRRSNRYKRPSAPSRGQANPLFPGQAKQLTGLFKYRVYLLLQAGCGLLLLSLLFYSPLFRINTIKITADSSASQLINQSLDKILDRHSLLILPVRNYFILNSRWLGQSLSVHLRNEISFSQLKVIKRFPDQVEIVATERLPIISWRSGDSLFGVDESGIVTRRYDSADSSNGLPLFIDENRLIVEVNQELIDPTAITSARQFISSIDSAGLQVESIIVPECSCPSPIPALGNSNLNSGPSTNQNSYSTFPSNTNFSSANERGITCDIFPLVYSTKELHAKIKDGPVVYFLIDNTSEQSDKLLRLIRDSNIDLKRLSYVDIRFGERIYYQ